jgi:hypothetical protein
LQRFARNDRSKARHGERSEAIQVFYTATGALMAG